MKSLIIFILGLISLASAAPTLEVRETDAQATDRLLFSTTISAFETARNAKNPPSLDWTSDGCSDSPDNPFGFDFLFSCHRHDFGYRNYKIQGRFEAGKPSIDSNFKKDMYAQCQTEGGAFEIAACKGVADVYYEAVKEFGDKKRGVEEIEKRERERNVAL
ncbi:prokaryotic phospholipase A2-domain-containing protein [Lophiotrema nucula]|uniref:Prokaryotic phospholipase A2-domain-containing protein n=1 Tax=Lophiotrema nucula TaxID=690887 RepID=A0A6A5Z867_9PLEO|nr:prokaryotic phospholipase A2-domain-containing protein [Lophiotrema nucula]